MVGISQSDHFYIKSSSARGFPYHPSTSMLNKGTQSIRKRAGADAQTEAVPPGRLAAYRFQMLLFEVYLI